MTTDRATSEIVREMQRLVADLDGQHRREEGAFAEGYRLGFAAGHDVGHEAGYRRSEAELDAAWKATAEKVRRLPREMQIVERRAKYGSISAYCVHGACSNQVIVHHRVDFRHVLCLTHAPKRWCAEHHENDACSYHLRLQATQRPEYTGGPVEWDTDQSLDRGTAA